MSIIEKSFWENLGAFDSNDAASRERFAEKLAAWRAQATGHGARHRTGYFDFSDLHAQDAVSEAHEEAA
jgi:alkanesulfonate monooxygenase SsuD/methylene tetrahydromethanopterin reductase-like flavin-dependent oxidoreductase (luciferase family)